MAVHRRSPHTFRVDSIETDQLYLTSGGEIVSLGAGGPEYPIIRFNSTTTSWEFSNNGVTFYAFGPGSGSSGDTFQKTAELTATVISKGVNHTIPGGLTYEVTADGDKLDVFSNGQLLTPRIGVVAGDYTEIDTTTIQFHFDVPKGTLLTFIIK